MGKIKLQVQISLDGFIAGPAGEMDWVVSEWDRELKDYVGALMEGVDHILLGRKLAEGFIPYWAANASEEGAAFMNETRKTVFSRTLRDSPWKDVVVEQGNAGAKIRTVKESSKKDLIVYGGADFASSLVAEGLIDEFFLMVNPTILGRGLSIFEKNRELYLLEASEAKTFGCGITVLHYGLKN
ncbi:MAG: dihydrofolate reductase [Chitinophagaceae bacterium]|nr:MAG: dihydrofolate reductase [Chitinophagaceae bacterium]